MPFSFLPDFSCGSTTKEKNLLLLEQISSLKSRFLFRRFFVFRKSKKGRNIAVYPYALRNSGIVANHIECQGPGPGCSKLMTLLKCFIKISNINI